MTEYNPSPYSHSAQDVQAYAAGNPMPPYAYSPMAYPSPYMHAPQMQSLQMPGVPPYFHPSAMHPWAMMQEWGVAAPQSPYQYSNSAPSIGQPNLEAATDPTLSGGFGWSMWRFDGQQWNLVLDQSAEKAKPAEPDVSSGKFVGQTVRTPSIRFERDDAELRADVLNDPAQMDEIVSRAMEIPGYGSEEEVRWIAGTAASLSPGSVWVEVGALCGRSFLAAGLALPKDATLITVDRVLGHSIRRGHTLFDTYHELTQSRWDLSIVLTRADSPMAATLFRDYRCDVVFLDGDHQAAAVQRDIASWIPKLVPGGMICGHDYGEPSYPGLTQVVDELPGSSVAVGSIWVWYPHVGG